MSATFDFSQMLNVAMLVKHKLPEAQLVAIYTVGEEQVVEMEYRGHSVRLYEDGRLEEILTRMLPVLLPDPSKEVD